MSAKLMGQVWELDLPHGEQLVMLALADHGEDDGSQIFPSVARLAWKTGYKQRQVQNILRSLETKGIIEPVAHAQGGRGMATEYKMNIEKGAKKAPFEKGAISERVQNPAQRVQSSTRKGAKSSTKGAIAIAPQPSYNHQIEPSVEPSRGERRLTPPPPSTSEPVQSETVTASPKKTSRAVKETPEETAYYAACVPVVARVCRIDLKVTGEWARCKKPLQALYHATVRPTPELLALHYETPAGYWYAHDFRGQKGETPEPHWIQNTWGKAVSAVPRIVQGGNGHARAAPPQEDGIGALRARLTGQMPPNGSVIEGRFKHG